MYFANGQTYYINATGQANLATTTVAKSLSVSHTGAAALDVAGGAQFGSGNVSLIDTTGKIPALSSTYFADLSGANLTALSADNISSGTLALARGGTAKGLTAAAGAIAYSDADSLELSAAGTAGQILTSGGTGAPTWQATSTLNAGLLDGVDSGSFLRSDTSDSYTSGTLTFDSGTTLTVNGTATFATSTFEKLLTISGGGLTISSGTITLPDASIVKDDLANSGTLSFDWADSELADALTISGGTINNTSIGASTASTAIFTTATSTIQKVIGKLTATTFVATGTTTLGATTTINTLAYTWPSSGAANGEFLKYNTNGLLTWETAGGSNADTLDSIDSASFLRSDTSDSFTSGILTFDAGTKLLLTGNLDVNGTSTFATSTFEKLLTVSGGGASITGGLNLNSGNITSAGTINSLNLPTTDFAGIGDAESITGGWTFS
ncbi:MAG: hypothetical protein UY09_C0037G0001, partial [Parcubacteria group bacterium GW2011_GWA2_47_8]